MIDADRYWAASGLFTGKDLPASSRAKTKPNSGITAEQLDGGCLLYRLRVPPSCPEGNIDDRTIRGRLLAELGREEWAKVWPEDIIVRDGIVHFWLSSDEPDEKRQALRVAAENIPGIRGVQEHVLPAPVIPAF